MLIKLVEDIAQRDIEVLIKFARKNRTVYRLISLINSVDREVRCTSEQKDQLWVKAMDIYYFESIDKKTFVYGEKSVYRTENRLYELLDQLSASGFVQISKSCIVNIHVLESIKTLPNSRIEATLTNGERVNVTRKYIPDIKAKLEER